MAENKIIIRFAVYDDVDRIMEAIKNCWDANHILALNKDFFLYIFSGSEDTIHMVIAEEQGTNEIVGFLGYIKYGINDFCDIALVLWKAIEGKEAFLGLKLHSFLKKHVNHRLFFSIGTNPETALPIYRSLKYHVGRLEHYYRISNRNEYKIAKIENKNILPIVDSEWSIRLISNFDIFNKEIDISLLENNHPHKDMAYIRHRFFEHPLYSYRVYAISLKNTEAISAFFVCREVEKFQTKILHIVDYMGEEKYFSYISFSLQELMDKNNYEYIDCYCFGMSEKTMKMAGFIQRKDDDKNIIPNYFEPFLCRNGEIYYFTNMNENVRYFKADADQDQPRLYDRSLC